jgi:hypothetical protein
MELCWAKRCPHCPPSRRSSESRLWISPLVWHTATFEGLGPRLCSSPFLAIPVSRPLSLFRSPNLTQAFPRYAWRRRCREHGDCVEDTTASRDFHVSRTIGRARIIFMQYSHTRLSHCHFGEPGARAIASSLRGHPRLRTLGCVYTCTLL